MLEQKNKKVLMLQIIQSLKTHRPTEIKIINSGIHFPEFQYYNYFLIANFLLHSTRDEWRAWEKEMGQNQ